MNSNFLGNINGYGTGYAGAVWDKECVCPTLTTMQGGGREPMIIESKEIGTTHWPHGWLDLNADFSGVAMRGRDPQNPSDRTAGNPNLEQRLEPNSEGICNTLTTVQKDNLVLVKQATKDGSIPCKIGGGGRLELPNVTDTQRQSNRSRECESNADNGEYP